MGWALKIFALSIIGLVACQQRSISNSGSRRQRVPAGKSEVASFNCPEDFGYYPHSSDCTQYYVCVFGGALQESCTGGLVYSHELQTCDWPRNVQCNLKASGAGISTVRITDPRTANTSPVRSATEPLTPSVGSFDGRFQNTLPNSQRLRSSQSFSSFTEDKSRKPKFLQQESDPQQSLTRFSTQQSFFDTAGQESSRHPVNANPTTQRPSSFPSPVPAARPTTSSPLYEDPFYNDFNLTDAEFLYYYDDLLLDYYDLAEEPVAPTTRAPPVIRRPATTAAPVRIFPTPSSKTLSRGGASRSRSSSFSSSSSLSPSASLRSASKSSSSSRGSSSTSSRDSQAQLSEFPTPGGSSFSFGVSQSPPSTSSSSVSASSSSSSSSSSSRPSISSSQTLRQSQTPSRITSSSKTSSPTKSRSRSQNSSIKTRTQTSKSNNRVKSFSSSSGQTSSQILRSENNLKSKSSPSSSSTSSPSSPSSRLSSSPSTTKAPTKSQKSSRQPSRTASSTPSRGSPASSGQIKVDTTVPKRNRRPTLKPVSVVAPTSSVSKVDIWKFPPKRHNPIRAQPPVDTPATKCDPKVCQLPDCYCGGKDIPGGIPAKNTPQMVLLTFDDSVNDLNKGLYTELFENGRKNPNGCPIVSTMYVSHEWTDYTQVQNLYADGHEMASHSIQHSFGEQFSVKKWAREIAGMREILSAYGGVKMEDVRGMRAPFLAVGGNKMFKMLYDQNFTYDSSMPVYENKPPSWPYTLDYKLFHDCMIPPCPTNSYPGVWEVPMVMWQDLNGGRCSMGDACTTPPDAEGVYKMLIKNFERHYTSNRAPFGLFYHAAWFTTPHHKEGFIAFLDTITAMDDVWLITNHQLLQWMRDPQSLQTIKNYAPFGCQFPDRTKCKSTKVCNVWHKGGVRYMRTCQQCPEKYPWTGNTGVRSPLNDV